MGGELMSRIVLPDLDDSQNAALHTNLSRLLDRQDANRRRSDMYDGKRALSLLRRSTVIPQQYYQMGIALGWCGKAVDGLTRRTQLEEFVWPDGDLGSLGMDGLLHDNFLLSEYTQALSDSALHGISFLINTRGTGDEPGSLIHAKDALNATGTWNNRRRALDDALSITDWDPDAEKTPTGLVFYLPGLTVSAARIDGRWVVTDRSEHPWGVPVEPLVYKPRPSRKYGASRLTRPIMGLQNQAVRELVRAEGHMDIYSYPELLLLGATQEAFKNTDGSIKPEWEVMLGRIKGIEDNPEKPDELARPQALRLPAASPEPHVTMLDMLSRAFAREASLPDSAVALKGVSNPTSADAYDASQYELIAEAEGAMRDWNTPLIRSVLRGLAIRNGLDTIPDQWRSITPKWLGAKFESRAAKADAGVKQLSTVPWLADTEVGLELLGLSPDQVARAMAEKRRAAGRQVLAALAGRTGVPGAAGANAG